MGKLNFLLTEDYLKPKIYFQSKHESICSYSYEDRNHFEGLEHLTHLLLSPKGFVVNAFQIDYYQTLPQLIARTLKEQHSYKKLYILGPALSLSILKRSLKTVYEKHSYDLGYINVESNAIDIFQQCIALLKEGHILYILPETSIHWSPEIIQPVDHQPIPLCSAVLSQKANVPILSSSVAEGSHKIKLHEPNLPQQYLGNFESRIYQQSELLYNLL